MDKPVEMKDDDFIKALSPTLPSVGTVEPCKGFWNHCGCAKCRQGDRELEAKLEAATPAERRKMIEDLGPTIMRAKGIKP